MINNEMLVSCRAIARLYEQTLSSARAKHNLTQFEADVLAFLNNNPGMDTASHIVEYRMLPKANVSQAVDLLIKKGLLTSRRDEADRRRVHISPTAAAGPVISDIIAAQKAFGEMLFADFTEAELSQLEAFNRRISENASRILGKK